jgi:GT2 family glycosyltransferase
MSKVYILVVNWNGWQDTIECLESVFRNDYLDYQVVICDNKSDDGSPAHIKDWAEGRQAARQTLGGPIAELTAPPVPKPIRWVEYSREEAEGGGAAADPPLALIRNSANLGFAAGNNVGLRYALARDDFEYVWLLNNDTVIRADALRHLVDRMREKPDAGMCGSTLVYYDHPDTIQAIGGARYNKWLGISRHIGARRPAGELPGVDSVERRMSYVTGASMLVSRTFLKDIGLMSEDYFLYYEELDWAMRMGTRYTLAYAPQSVVYHKEGATIGASNLRVGDKSLTSDYFSLSNRVRFTRKFIPHALPTVYLGLLLSLANRVRRGQWDRVAIILRILAGTGVK